MQRRWAAIYIAFFLVLAVGAYSIETFGSGSESGGLTYVMIFSLVSAFLIAALSLLPRRG